MEAPVAERIGHRLERLWSEPPGIGTWLDTVDHKRIGKHYIYTAFAFFTAGGVEAAVMRTQLARPDQRILNPEAYNQLFSMHGITMIFFFVTPMLFGFGNYFIPLMIGSRDMAFPRLNAFGYWIFLFSGLFVYSSFLIGKAPNDGWFNYSPISDTTFTPGLNIDYYTLGLIFLGLSTTVGSVNFIVTIFKLRAPGMSIARMPLYVWAILATSFATSSCETFSAVTSRTERPWMTPSTIVSSSRSSDSSLRRRNFRSVRRHTRPSVRFDSASGVP